MAFFFVDTSTGNDANDGRDNIGVGLSTATWTEATLTLTQAGHGYTFAAGDVIYLSAGTGVTVDLYEVVSSTSNDIVLKETSTLPGIGNASDLAAGDLAAGDITSSDGPKLTLNGGEAVNVAGDQTWVRGSSDYVETGNVTVLGTNTAPIIWEGYTTTLGDDGKVTIDGQSSRTSGITDSITTFAYRVFKNFIIKNHTGDGVSLSIDMVRFLRCELINNGGRGLFGDNTTGFQDCIITGNSSDGVEVDNAITMHGCLVATNTLHGVQADWGVVAMCDVFSNGSMGISLGVGNVALRCALNNTVDGDGKDTTIGISFSTSNSTHGFCINNLVYDCATGLEWTGVEMVGSSHNLLNANTADYAGTAGTWDGEVTGAPVFTDEAGEDRTLGSGSPAIGAGIDAAAPLGVSEEMSIGAFQVAAGAPGGGSGLLTHPGTSGGARA